MIAVLVSMAAHAANPKIGAGAILPITQSAYPKTYQKWGAAGIARINALLPKAADKVTESAECDRLDIIELSDERSIPKKKIVFFADCANGKRFYVSDDELKNQTVITSKQSKTATLSDSAVMGACMTRVKAQLNHPSTFKLHSFSQSVYRAPTGNVVAEFMFSAKNTFGLETKHKAKCYTDDRGMSDPEILEDDK